METMIDKLKALLRNEENLDERELHYEFEQLTDRYLHIAPKGYQV